MKDSVKEYYGKILQGSHDLKTDACCTDTAMPAYLRRALSNIHDDVQTRYYGCGLVSPQLLEGMRVLDLGCGSGRDCYLLSQLVGEDGYVLGVDMTSEQLEVASRHVDYHTERFGYKKPNLAFRLGHIEKLEALGLEDDSFDIIVSNCVINLSPEKEAVLHGAYRLLRPGGELYFSDVYADRRIPGELMKDPVLYGECLSGALYWNDFLRLAIKAGFPDPRLVEDRPITVDNLEIAERIGHVNFYSATYRLFKLHGLESACEDYGQAVVYKGGIPHSPELFKLDKHHLIERGRVFPVCGNTFRMLKETRFSSCFDFYGDQGTHYGIFADCGVGLPFDSETAARGDGGSCC